MNAATSSLLQRPGQFTDQVNKTLMPKDLLPGRHVEPLTGHDALVKQTQIWVSQTFFGALLKQMRESPFRSELFDGGRGGQAFGPVFDQHLADRMARGAGKKLVNSIVRKIEAKRAYAKQDGVAAAERSNRGNNDRPNFTR